MVRLLGDFWPDLGGPTLQEFELFVIYVTFFDENIYAMKDSTMCGRRPRHGLGDSHVRVD